MTAIKQPIKEYEFDYQVKLNLTKKIKVKYPYYTYYQCALDTAKDIANYVVQNNLIDIRDCLDVKIINLKPTKPQTYCKHCGTPLKINYGRGRPRQFCSDSHKNMWSLKQREERKNEL